MSMVTLFLNTLNSDGINYTLLQPILDYGDEEDFYYIQLIPRKKDQGVDKSNLLYYRYD